MDEKRFSHEKVWKTPEILLKDDEAPEFSLLKFENLAWQESQPTGDIPVYRAETAFITDGRRLILEASNQIYTQNRGRLSSLFFRIRSTKENPAGVNLFVNIADREQEPQLKVSMNITRDEGSEDLPPGMGISVYEKGLDFLSRVAANKPLIHTEFAAPDDGNLDKWNARFAPVLKEPWL